MTEEPVFSQIAALDQQRTALIETAKTDALTKATAAVKTLNGLGFGYRLVEPEKAKAAGTGTRPPKDAPCAVCGFKTVPPHGGRSHRGQATKAPFTAEELSTRGYVQA